MSLQFDVFDGESGGFNYPDRTCQGLLDELNDLLDGHESGELGDKPYLAALERVLARAPDLINAHSIITHHWHELGKPKKALEAALLGLGAANRHIPEGFTGRIEWGHLENRPYLRLMHVALLSYMRLRRHRGAVKIIESMLARNPNDNQGVRYLLGSELLRAGDIERARAVLAAEADSYPPYFYELALACMLNNDWVAAATALRRGFAANPYIAEYLGGNPYPLPLAIWHGNNFAEPETAIDYAEMYDELWLTPPDGFAFVRWLFNHSKVLAERAAIMECREALLSEDDASARSKIIAQARGAAASIDDAISIAIVKKRKNVRGKLVWPWTT